LKYDFCVVIREEIGCLSFPNEYLIEYDGIQHFKPVKMFGGEEAFKLVQKYDTKKNSYAKDKEKPLLRVNKKSNLEKEICSFLQLQPIPNSMR